MKKVALLFGFVMFCSLPLRASTSIKVPILNFLLSLQEEQLNHHRNDINKFVPDDDAEKLILAVITNDLAGVREFLADPDIDVNDLLDIGIAPLHYIAVRKNTDTRILEAFLANNRVNVNIRDVNGFTPIHHAVLRGSLDNVKVLFASNRVDVNARLTIQTNISKEYLSISSLLEGMTVTPLFLALGTRNLDMIRAFFAEERVDVNAPGGEFSHGILQHAVMLELPVPIIEEILAEDQVNVNARDEDGDTALFYAATKGLLDMVKVLLANDRVDVNAPGGSFSQTPIQQAIATHNVPVIRAFLANNRVDINATDRDGDTVLDWAIIEGNPEIIQELINRGARSSGGREQMWIPNNFNVEKPKRPVVG